MDYPNYITESPERKKGQHLQREERDAIQHLKRQGYSNRRLIVERLAAHRPPCPMNFGEVHRPVKVEGAKYLATLSNEERRSTDPTDSIMLTAALTSSL